MLLPSQSDVYIGLGSNIDEPLRQLRDARLALAQIPKTNLVACSSFYSSKPHGPQDQPDFLNAVIKLTTSLAPLMLLDHLQTIELQQGRIRKQRWGPRCLDIDVLLFGEQIISDERLFVPHPRMAERSFVLYPLHEIAPSLILPSGQKLTTLVDSCPQDGLKIVSI